MHGIQGMAGPFEVTISYSTPGGTTLVVGSYRTTVAAEKAMDAVAAAAREGGGRRVIRATNRSGNVWATITV